MRKLVVPALVAALLAVSTHATADTYDWVLNLAGDRNNAIWCAQGQQLPCLAMYRRGIICRTEYCRLIGNSDVQLCPQRPDGENPAEARAILEPKLEQVQAAMDEAEVASADAQGRAPHVKRPFCKNGTPSFMTITLEETFETADGKLMKRPIVVFKDVPPGEVRFYPVNVNLETINVMCKPSVPVSSGVSTRAEGAFVPYTTVAIPRFTGHECVPVCTDCPR